MNEWTNFGWATHLQEKDMLKDSKNAVWTNWWTLRKLLVGAGKTGRRTASSWRTEMERLRELYPGETGEGVRTIIKSSQHTKTGQPLIRRAFAVSYRTMLGFSSLLQVSSVLVINITLWSPFFLLWVFGIWYKNLKISPQVSGILVVDNAVSCIIYNTESFLSYYTTADNWDKNHTHKCSDLKVLGLINCIDCNWENNCTINWKQVNKFAWPTIAFAWFWNPYSRFIVYRCFKEYQDRQE